MTTTQPTTSPPGGHSRPAWTGDFDQDLAILTDVVRDGDRALSALPPKPHRDGGQRLRAELTLSAIRVTRRDFLARHAATAYDRLTDDRTRHLRLPDLVAAAARLPGIVPAGEQLAADESRIQADKEGFEIDVGIFCGAILRSPAAGRHLIDAMLMPTPAALERLDEFRATGRAELGTVVLQREGAAAHVTFQNTRCLNAEDQHLIADLETAVDLVLLDEDVRVGILRGGFAEHPKYRGRRVFSAGINLSELRDGRIPLVGFLLGRELGYVHKMRRGLPAGAGTPSAAGKPWVAVVDAFAIGGGMQLLLVADHVIAERDAFFSLPAADEGIVPGLANLRLPRLVGGRLARRMILGGERLAATDPEARLLCDEVVSPDAIDESVAQAVARLSAPAVPANRAMLNLAEEPLDQFRAYLAEFAEVQAIRSYSEDVLAKVERRRVERQGR